MLKKLIYIMLIILWANVIFFYSSEVGEKSDERSMRIGAFVYNKIEKTVPEMTLGRENFNYLVRKGGHVGEYFILTFLILGLLSTVNVSIKYKYIISWLMPSIYSVVDEYNQVYVPGRDGSINDVFIDNIGIILAIILFIAAGNKYKKKKSKM